MNVRKYRLERRRFKKHPRAWGGDGGGGSSFSRNAFVYGSDLRPPAVTSAGRGGGKKIKQFENAAGDETGN